MAQGRSCLAAKCALWHRTFYTALPTLERSVLAARTPRGFSPGLAAMRTWSSTRLSIRMPHSPCVSSASYSHGMNQRSALAFARGCTQNLRVMSCTKPSTSPTFVRPCLQAPSPRKPIPSACLVRGGCRPLGPPRPFCDGYVIFASSATIVRDLDTSTA